MQIVIPDSMLICLSKAAAKKQHVNEADAEATIRRWLKNASDRDGGRKQRADMKKRKFTQNVSNMILCL